MTSKQLTLSLSLATILVGSQALADEEMPPRGREIEALAGNCAIGPFGQTGKAGQYNPHCATLTDAEKCLALVKQSFNSQNGETRPSWQGDKAAHCIDVLRAELLSQ